MYCCYQVNIQPDMSIEWLLPQVVYGGLWGMIFLLPFLNKGSITIGLLGALIPAAVQLLIVLPFIENQGLMGQTLGTYAPLFFLGAWLLWGLTTMIWFRLAK